MNLNVPSTSLLLSPLDHPKVRQHRHDLSARHGPNHRRDGNPFPQRAPRGRHRLRYGQRTLLPPLSLLQIVVCSNHLPHDGKYLTTKDKHKTLLKTVDFVPSKPLPDEQAAAVEQAIRYGALVGEGTVNARIWANEQSSELNPRSLELLCRRICERDNVEFKVLQVDLRSEGEA